jgi:hypothetical protein
MNHYCDIWYWRASDQEAVARHLRDRARTTGEPETPRRAGLLRSALLFRAAHGGADGAAGRGETRSSREETRYGRAVAAVRRSSSTGRPCSTTGEWVLRCPECGHLDRLLGSRRRPGLSWWGWRGGDGGCG